MSDTKVDTKWCNTCEVTEADAVMIEILDLFEKIVFCEDCHDKLPEPSWTQPE